MEWQSGLGEDAQSKYKVCADGLREAAEAAGFTEMLVGLSGGLDSSVVATLCVDVFGAERVHGVLMPGPYSSDHSIADASALAANLGISTQTISICEPYQAFEQVLAGPCGDAWGGVAAQNTQARARMVVLMALSNAHGWMLVNTGNKTEAQLGYSTLYGDTAGAFAPIGCLYKTDVFAVARWRNDEEAACGGVGPIPAHVLVKPPSAELAPGQRDEASLGAPYAVLDRVLEAYVEHGEGASAIAAAEASLHDGLSMPQLEALLSRVEANAFKRAMEPPFPRARIYG